MQLVLLLLLVVLVSIMLPGSVDDGLVMRRSTSALGFIASD